MKIIYIISGLELGGAEKQVSDMCDQLMEMGHEIQIISMMGRVDLLPNNSEVIVHALNMKKNPVSLLHSLFTSISIMLKFSPDIIHGHLFHGNIFSRVLKLFFPFTPLINTEHSKHIGSNLRHIAYRFTNFTVGTFTNVSKEALDNFTDHKTFPSSRSICIYNGIKTNRYVFSNANRLSVRSELGLEDGDHLFLSVGRLAKAKDYLNLLESFKLISEDASCKLAIIGDGEERLFIETKVQQLKIEDKVFLLGSKTDIERYLSSADTFVLSSAWEGFGLVVAEAMCCKRFIVATDAGGVSEVMGNNEFIVPIKNSRKLAEKMRESIFIDSIKKEQITDAGYNRVISTFDIKKVCQDWESLYSSLINSKNN